VTAAPDPSQIDYVIYSPDGGLEDFAPYTNAKAVLSLWAGVDRIVANTTLTQPLVRMVDPVGLTGGMVEWVSGHVLRHHLGMDAHIHGQDGDWRTDVPPLAQNRPVTILGLGELGQAVAHSLTQLGFPVTGWSRSTKTVENVTCLAGETTLNAAVSDAQILVLLLPDTPATDCIVNADVLAALPKGAFLINPGRGTLIDDAALLAALDADQIGHATLDTFRTEPLPKDHRFWSHPKVTVTPHIASETRPETASQVIAQNIHRNETGRPLLHLVDKALGY
jgi:glyoxylate/hydroxypyruvate reductase A